MVSHAHGQTVTLYPVFRSQGLLLLLGYLRTQRLGRSQKRNPTHAHISGPTPRANNNDYFPETGLGVFLAVPGCIPGCRAIVYEGFPIGVGLFCNDPGSGVRVKSLRDISLCTALVPYRT